MSKMSQGTKRVKGGGASSLAGEQQATPLIERWLAARRARLVQRLAVCESPIEVVFAVALMSATDADGTILSLVEFAPTGPAAMANGGPLAYGRAGSLLAQHEVAVQRRVLRIDFALIADKLRLAIELDGHDFHASKQARSADAERDRLLTKHGWTPVRFTGSDIWRDADGCAAKTLDLLGFKVLRGEIVRPAEVSAPGPAPTLEEAKAGAAGVLAALRGDAGTGSNAPVPRPFSRRGGLQ